MIPNYTIYSDKVTLTANFYVEYLGFNLLYKDEDKENPYVWLEFNNQFLLIWPWDKKLGIARPAVFEVSEVFDWYFELGQKVRINVPLNNKDGNHTFSILDCEGNIINFVEGRSQSRSSYNELESSELTLEVKNS